VLLEAELISVPSDELSKLVVGEKLVAVEKLIEAEAVEETELKLSVNETSFVDELLLSLVE
jgi:hypothetical protein